MQDLEELAKKLFQSRQGVLLKPSHIVAISQELQNKSITAIKVDVIRVILFLLSKKKCSNTEEELLFKGMLRRVYRTN